MRLIVVGMLSLFLVHCGAKSQKAATRERETLSPQNYEALKQLNTLLVENEDAMTGTLDFLRSEKAQAMAKVLKAARCGYTKNETRRDDFAADWSASKRFEGADCPVHAERSWRYGNRNRELVVYHSFVTTSPEYRKLNGINKVDGSGSIQVRTDASGGQRITGEIKYDTFEIDGAGSLGAVVRTNQSYQGAKGSGNVTVTVFQRGGFSFTGGIRWDARDFARRAYFVGGESLDAKSFRELFSFFDLDKVVDDSERMR